MVDVDIEEVIEFCQRFEKEYIAPSLDVVSLMKNIANNIDSGLRGTNFATTSSSQVIEMAKQLETILDQGDQRIRVLERKAQDDLDRGRAFTR